MQHSRMFTSLTNKTTVRFRRSIIWLALFVPLAVSLGIAQTLVISTNEGQDSVKVVNDSVEVVEQLSDDSLPVFIRTEYRDGLLHAFDTLGREWVYDDRIGRLTLRWDDALDASAGLSRSRRHGLIFCSGGDTVVVEYDRAPSWATRLERLPSTIHGEVVIEEMDYITERIRATGAVVVNGLVEADVFSETEIIVTSTGIIDGDVFAPSIDVQPGGLITGREKLVSQTGEFGGDLRGLVDVEALPVLATIAIALLIVAFISLSVSPQAVARAGDVVRIAPGKAFLTGFLGLLLYGPVVGIVMITIVGIPLGILMIIALPWAVLVGIVAATQYWGGQALAAYGKSIESSIKNIIIGILILFASWGLAIALIDSRSEFLSGWGVFMLIVSIVITSVAAVTGFGGVALTRFGRREYVPGISVTGSRVPPPPTPPPVRSSDDSQNATATRSGDSEGASAG